MVRDARRGRVVRSLPLSYSGLPAQMTDRSMASRNAMFFLMDLARISMLCLVSVACGVSSPSSHSSNAVANVVVDGVSLMSMAA